MTEVGKNGKDPKYLEWEVMIIIIIGTGTRANKKEKELIKLRRGNLEEDNKYWLEEEKQKYVFCKKEKDESLYQAVWNSKGLVENIR